MVHSTASTPLGNYSTFLKYVADDMASRSLGNAGLSAYDLPNVPFTQYYLNGGYAIHGAYWHDQFGSDQSHGCINLTWADAAYLFSQTDPKVPQGAVDASSAADEAPPVVIVN